MIDPLTVVHGDCVEVMRSMPEHSVDAIVTDPPYGLGFMGKEWDSIGDTGRGARARTERASEVTPAGSGHTTAQGMYLSVGVDSLRSAGKPFQAWTELWAIEALRVLKPGGYLLSFGGTRTYHRMTCAIEDAGFEIRDCLVWMYGSGFPKSLDVSKAIDKAAGAEREVVGSQTRSGRSGGILGKPTEIVHDTTLPSTPEAQKWSGWGTALKPAFEPVIMAQKPHDYGAICATIGSHLDRLEAEWQAREADQRTRTGVAGASSDQTDTSQFESASAMSSNTVASWRRRLAELSEATSTSTIAITSGLITDLRTLCSCLSQITPASMAPSSSLTSGSRSSVAVVAALFVASVLRLRAIRELSVDVSATGRTVMLSQDEVALSPDLTPIVLARKPLIGTVVANVERYGTGALNIDGSRIGTDAIAAHGGGQNGEGRKYGGGSGIPSIESGTNPHFGRWPANVLLDEESARLVDEASGELQSGSAHVLRRGGTTGKGMGYGSSAAGNVDGGALYGDRGGASRFFYTAKASRSDRGTGNVHPTVKPVALMRYLVRLVTPPGGLVLDPFAGSGTTGQAALAEGFRCTLIEKEAEYIAGIKAWRGAMQLGLGQMAGTR